MIKTLTLGGLTSVKIKQSAYDMARFCWIKNLSEADVFASCVNAECTENADEVRRISSGEFGMLDTESYETLYLNGSGAVEIVTSAYAVCPFERGGKGGGSYELPIATTEILGGVMPDGTTITVDENGVISGSSNSLGTVGSNVKPVYFSNGVPKECAYKIYTGYLTISNGGSSRMILKHGATSGFSLAPYVFLQIHVPNVSTYSSEYGAHIYANEYNQLSFAYNLPANSTIYYFLIGYGS